MNPGHTTADREAIAAALGISVEEARAFGLLTAMEHIDLHLDLPGPAQVMIRGVSVRKGSRVRLHPRPGGDILDLALAGKVAFIEAIEQDFENRIHLAVTVEDDPGRDLGDARQPGHRFFFSPEEVEPLDHLGGHNLMATRILVAGIGNIFLADDGFGVEVVRRLARKPLPDSVQVVDFGIRGMDLVYALLEDYQALIFVDTVSRGEPAGTLYLIEPQVDQAAEVSLDTHGMDPVKVLALAHSLGAKPTTTFLVACEPALLGGADDEDVLVQLSPPVQAAVDPAVLMVESLLAQLTGLRTPEQAGATA